MSEINVTFTHPETNGNENAMAQVTIVGTDAAGIVVLPGETQTFEADPGVYAIFVAVTTRAGTNWTIDITATGGDEQKKKGKGPGTLLFSQISVEGEQVSMLMKAASHVPSFNKTNNIHIDIKPPFGAVWSVHITGTGQEEQVHGSESGKPRMVKKKVTVGKNKEVIAVMNSTPNNLLALNTLTETLPRAFESGRQQARQGGSLSLPIPKTASIQLRDYAPIIFSVQYLSSLDRARYAGYRFEERGRTPEEEQDVLEAILAYPSTIFFHAGLNIPDQEQMRINQDVSLDVSFALEDDKGHILSPSKTPSLGLPLDGVGRDIFAAIDDELLFDVDVEFDMQGTHYIKLQIKVDAEDAQIMWNL